jgi:hypothetical protein
LQNADNPQINMRAALAKLDAQIRLAAIYSLSAFVNAAI